MLGLQRGTVKLEPYHQEWAGLFEEERQRILSIAKNSTVDIQHIGSTAIQRVPAKPIIDIMIAISSMSEIDRWVQILGSLGYQHRGEKGIPGRHFFAKDSGESRTHHLHLVESGSLLWKEYILFRDYLRKHKETVDEYTALKIELAEKFKNDRDSYTEGKAEFIQAVIERAKL